MTTPALAFALIISGTHAPTPAPRCAAVDAELAGLRHVGTGRRLRPDYDSFRAALPSALRRYVTAKRVPFPSFWYDKRARFEGGRTQVALPFYHIRNAKGALVATVYAALVEG